MLLRRVIPCLDVAGGRVVKGTRFVDLRDAGDPAELAARYAAAGADEIVLLDITAAPEGRATLLELVQPTPPPPRRGAARGGGGGSGGPRGGCSCPSPWAAACAPRRACERCSAPAPTKWPSTRPPSPTRDSSVAARASSGGSASSSPLTCGPCRRPAAGWCLSAAAGTRQAWMPWPGLAAPPGWGPVRSSSRRSTATARARGSTWTCCAP